MGIIRACVCSLLLLASASILGACSGDDDGGSSGPACHCDFGDTCMETSTPCANIACSSPEEPGPCSDTDVIGTCNCTYDSDVHYYRSSFAGNPQEECESMEYCYGVYTPR